MLKFFLNSEGGALAFKKEKDHATFPGGFLISNSDSVSLPANVTDAIDVSGYRNSLVDISADDSVYYDVKIYHAKKTGEVTNEFFLVDEAQKFNGNNSFKVEVDLYDYLFIRPVNIEGGTLSVEVGLVEWDTD